MTRALASLLALWLGLACSAEPPGREGADAQQVVAVLDGEPIRRSDVSAPIAFRVYRHEVDIHSLLRSETERLVDERLLAREAERRGIDVDALLESVEGGAAPVSQAEVDRYLAENPAETRAPADELRTRVRHYLEQRRRIERRLALLEGLREQAGFEWVLAPPEPPRTRIDVAGAPARGPADAPVTLVHFAGFAERHSRRSAANVERLLGEFPNRVRQIHRNHLERGDEAGLLAARVGFLAQDAGHFWEFHDALFARDDRLDEAAIATAARAAGLGDDALARARRDAALLDRLQRDLQAGLAAGVPRAPALFVNGRYASGLLPYEELRSLVEEELARAGA